MNATRISGLLLAVLGSALTAVPDVHAERFPAAATDNTSLDDRSFSVTAHWPTSRIVFDLDERLWLLEPGSPIAQPLTGSDKRYRRPVFSPDGESLAFESIVDNYHHIFVLHLDSGEIRQLTLGSYDHFAPDWSPRDGRIAMASNRGGTLDIWSIDPDTRLLKQLTWAATDETDPAWDQAGERLAFVATSPTDSTLKVWSPGQQPLSVWRSRDRLQAPAWQPGIGMLTFTTIDAQSSRLNMLLLSDPVSTKPLTRRERIAPRPVHWIDRTEFLYSADGQIRRRILGLNRYEPVPFVIDGNLTEPARETVSGPDVTD